ncbi:MAG: thiol reductant ABC exporter subunit CydC [Gammaproteobacteria bacterium]
MRDLVFFFGLFKAQWRWLLGGWLLSLLTAFAAIALLTLSGWFICAAALAGLAADGAALAFNFLQPAAEIRALAIMRTLGRYAERIVTHEATFRVLAQVRAWFFTQMLPRHDAALRSGDVLSRMTADVDALDALYLRLAAPLLSAAVGSAAMAAFLYAYAPPIAVSTLLLLGVSGAAVPWLFNRLGHEHAAATVAAGARLRSHCIEMLQGLGDLLANQAENRFRNAAAQHSQQLIALQRRNNRLAAVSAALTPAVAQSALLVALVLGAAAFAAGQLPGATLAMLLFCILGAFELVMPLPPALQMLGATQAAAHRVRSAAQAPLTVAEPETPCALPAGNTLRVEKLGFRYADRAPWVLHDVDLTVEAGRKLLLLGPSGAGKTTLLHCLLRFADPQQGRIALDGIDYRQIASDALLSRFGVLSQRTQLFAASVKDNILLAKPDAGSAELTAAIAAAGLQDFMRGLPAGLNTWVGEHGCNVSGGEARRIALARVYLKNAPILLLDEPTEGLDAAAEEAIFAALRQLAADKTVLMVSHRLKHVDWFDAVYRLRDGRLLAM